MQKQNVRIRFPGGQLLLRIRPAESFAARFFGYMGRKAPHCPGILFTNCNSIHSFFMHFDLDLLFLDKKGRVLRKVLGLGRRKMVFPVEGAWQVLELPAGKLPPVEVGDTVLVEPDAN
ncbi:DUF192 domain-containing protein [Anaerotalea alkaliphila]|uniref:DUF192 domain-containing protein n=1 Tax=Anaerotalea alkaliphila TaxID=2662126 RepID=A0A7X5HVE0_9FIRM|nr:DUF192 domain-containing protein [Anaerotalea alkaliphila]NDL67329.1 DUF192 domain-containing protein [Anaerotalea alkaliphila]